MQVEYHMSIIYNAALSYDNNAFKAYLQEYFSWEDLLLLIAGYKNERLHDFRKPFLLSPYTIS